MNNFKEGDIVVHMPGFNNGLMSDTLYGGAGYTEGTIDEIKELFEHSKGNVIWFKQQISYGVFEKALRLANQLEIEAYYQGIYNIKEIKQNIELFPIY